ncbi:MAG: hypothetical protein Q7U04_05010 [Bacteriovorax sp.]|nr:hypothetical protein [Bacteriovorax sp.]
MKNIKILFSFIILFTLNASASLVDWKLSRDVEGLKVWQYTTNSDITGSSETRKVASKTDWSKINGVEFFKSFGDKKKGMLALINITNWKATSFKWTPHVGYYQLNIVGIYTDPFHHEISFVEEHLYYPDHTTQLLHTHPLLIENGEALGQEIIKIMRTDAGISND